MRQSGPVTAAPLSRRRALGVLGAAGASVVGLFGAVKYLGSPAPRPRVADGTRRVAERYGTGPRQSGEWWVPPGPATGVLPTVVLVHGGYWRAQYGPSLEDAVAADLAGRGFLVWNVDYAPSSTPWPATLRDAALAYDHLAKGSLKDRVGPVAVVGHSAGGHLALWLASRGRVPAGGPGVLVPGVPAPRLVVAQAPVASLAEGSRLGLGAGAVDALLGGDPVQVPDRYRAADPVALLPNGVESVLVHGDADDLVPISQSEQYVAAATGAGDRSRLVRVPGGHFAHLDPRSRALEVAREALSALQ